jgi:hypothetical protein
MERESSGLVKFAAYDEETMEFFHVVAGSKSAASVELPWLDVEKAFFIAVNLEPGADIGIALDYRTSAYDPCVVATAWQRTGHLCQLWREVSPTFSAFVARLGLTLP